MNQVYGEGEQTRSFQYVSDLVDGLIALMNCNYSQPVNIGNPEEYTIMQFAKVIRDAVGRQQFCFILSENSRINLLKKEQLEQHGLVYLFNLKTRW